MTIPRLEYQADAEGADQLAAQLRRFIRQTEVWVILLAGSGLTLLAAVSQLVHAY
jgi:hypothetical protein